MLLIRKSKDLDGVFGELMDEQKNIHLAYTLEHAYKMGSLLAPKIPVGVYPCIRGEHRLLNMNRSFETFAICSVPGHSGILFHPGNIQYDSSGCVLLGKEIIAGEKGRMLTDSKETFEAFMNYLFTANNFQLTVKNEY